MSEAMTPTWLAIPIITIMAALAWMAIWSRRDTWARPIAVVIFICAVPAVAYAGIEMLGRHKPLWAARDLPKDTLVLAAVLKQDKAIWLYAVDPMRDEPRPLVLPWSNETAEAIQQAMDGAPEGSEGQFVMRYDEQEGEREFHSLPQPALPAKDMPDAGVFYKQPAS